MDDGNSQVYHRRPATAAPSRHGQGVTVGNTEWNRRSSQSLPQPRADCTQEVLGGGDRIRERGQMKQLPKPRGGQPSGHPPPTNPAAPHRFNWDSILSQHDRWLRTIVYVRLGEPQAVDDVMQEVALAAVRQSAPINDPQKVAPWLYRLAVRQSLLYRRKMGRSRNLTRRYADRYRPTERDVREHSPLEWLLSDERHASVRKALTNIRSTDAELLLMKYAQNWNYHQIAEHLGISHSAVEARLHRARARLRKELMSMQVVGEFA